MVLLEMHRAVARTAQAELAARTQVVVVVVVHRFRQVVVQAAPEL
jgi:hypothetical protein